MKGQPQKYFRCYTYANNGDPQWSDVIDVTARVQSQSRCRILDWQCWTCVDLLRLIHRCEMLCQLRDASRRSCCW